MGRTRFGRPVDGKRGHGTWGKKERGTQPEWHALVALRLVEWHAGAARVEVNAAAEH